MDRFFLEAGQRAEPGTLPPPAEQEGLTHVAAVGERYHLFQAAGEN
ncbi:hypothetical protein [Kitasatospora sp. HPMI-4]